MNIFTNPWYLAIIATALLGWIAQKRVKDIYDRYSADPNSQNISGLEAARLLLSSCNLNNVRIEVVQGRLTDHYDPQAKILRLTDGVANGRSVTSLSIVAHEVGHAAQDAEGYRFMRLRGVMANRLSRLAQLSGVVFVGGILFSITPLMYLGGLMLGALTFFSLVTLPVERNASTRALTALEKTSLAVGDEIDNARRVLRVAAFTYLAGLARQSANLLFFVVVILAAQGA
jgi:Zn-dependent membrane protease YugP